MKIPREYQIISRFTENLDAIGESNWKDTILYEGRDRKQAF